MAKHMRAQQLSTPMVVYIYTPVGVEAIPIIQKKKTSKYSNLWMSKYFLSILS